MAKKKVLIVDDEEDIRTLIKNLLENEGYDVSAARNGKECLAELRKKKFDLILIDFFMPRMSGRELAEKIRNDPKLKDAKFAFLTAAQFGGMGKKELNKLNSLDYITKPFSNKDLKERIKKMI